MRSKNFSAYPRVKKLLIILINSRLPKKSFLLLDFFMRNAFDVRGKDQKVFGGRKEKWEEEENRKEKLL